MKIAIIIEQPVENGGGFQQSLNAALEIQKESKNEFIVFVKDNKSAEVLRKMSIDCKILKFSRLQTFFLNLRRDIFLYTQLRKISFLNSFEKLLKEHSVDLVYFVGPSSYALDCENINFIFTIWDLCHLQFPEFPEVRNQREIEKREFLYQNAIKKAVAIICDSETGKKNLERIYNVSPERIFVNYFQPSAFITSVEVYPEIISSKNIEPGYLFYPAQFWPHKNHIYIIDALILNKKNKGQPIKVVFSGSDKGTANQLRKLIKDNNLIEDVHFVGFIPNEHLRTYYTYCKALIMPSYFGPTNIPPLEAIVLNRPVLYTDTLTNELLKRTKNIALVHPVDLNNPTTMLEALIKIDSNPPLEIKLNSLIEFPSPLSQILKKYEFMRRLFL